MPRMCSILRLTTLEGVLYTSNLVIGTTGIVGSRANLRAPYPLARLGVKLSGAWHRFDIGWGAEDQGLPNAVLQECDMIVNIETSLEYPVMNISHAAAIVLYSIGSTASATPKRKVASHADLDRLLQHASDVLELIDFPTHKRQRVSMTLKRIFSRSELSAAEVRTLRGVLGRIEYRLRREDQLRYLPTSGRSFSSVSSVTISRLVTKASLSACLQAHPSSF